MDVQIIYEHVERELYNAFLIKFELEKRGYDVSISRYNEIKLPSFNVPKLIIMPWVFDDESLDLLRYSYIKKFDKILNLQYEQILSPLWLDIGYHVPTGTARNVNFLCWGNDRKQVLLDEGISEEDIVVIGDIRHDFTKPEFREFYKTREELSDEFDIPLNHEWNLFVSSLAFTNQDEDHVEYYSNIMGNKYYYEWCDYNIKSQRIILEWIKQFLDENPNHEFIYRPHPSEVKENDYSMLLELDKDYSNFHFIFKYSVQDWILNSDYINFWFSTAIVECYSLNKSCNILRPIEIDEYFDVPFYVNAEQVKDYGSFKEKNVSRNNRFPIDSKEIKLYYNNLNNDEFVYKKLCDYIEKMIADDSFKKDFYPRNHIVDKLEFFLSRIWKNRIFDIFKNIISEKRSNEVKSVEKINYSKIEILKKIVDDNFD